MKTSVPFLILFILTVVVTTTCADVVENPGDDGLPKFVDWREKNVVTSVKNQMKDECLSCWAFSTTGALEGQWAIATGILVNLSAQQLVDCNTANHGCEGGWPARAFSYIINTGGINSQAAYPYTAKDGKCKKKTVNAANMINYEFVTGYNQTDLKRAVAEIGPISVTIYASKAFDDYMGGMFHCDETDSVLHSNHAVLVVGYGTKTNSSGQDYWIVKNSYGTKWGDNGYMWMVTNWKDNKTNPCGIANHAFYPVVSKTCNGGDSCCTNSNCHEGEGDCDSNSDCYGNLVCGFNNCRTGWPGDRSSFDATDDCCISDSSK